MTWWDSIGEKVSDGFGDLIEAGVDKAVREIAPVPANEVSQNPTTHAITQNVGVSSDGSTVTEPVKPYNSGFVGQLGPNAKWLLVGGVALVGAAWLIKKA